MLTTLIRRELLDNLNDVPICGSCLHYVAACRREYRRCSSRITSNAWKAITLLSKSISGSFGSKKRIPQGQEN